MANFNEFFKRVAKWNELRSPRIYNKDLTRKLLLEEHNELLEAQTAVDRLDALCDLIYVATGAIWKLKQDRPILSHLAKPKLWVDGFVDDSDLIMLKGIVSSCLSRMGEMGLTHKQCLRALMIVCDSNDTKPVKMTASSVKIAKGDTFVAPEPRLAALLNEVGAVWTK